MFQMSFFFLAHPVVSTSEIAHCIDIKSDHNTNNLAIIFYTTHYIVIAG